MSLEPWIVRTALAILAINAVNVLLFLAVRRLHKGTDSAENDADTLAEAVTPVEAATLVMAPSDDSHVPSTTA